MNIPVPLPPSTPVSAPPRKENFLTGPVVITALVSIVATTLFWAVCAGVLYFLFVVDPPPYAISLQAPTEVQKGETFTVRAQITNPTDEPLLLGSIDVWDSFLDGFTLSKIEPEPSSRDSLFDFHTFYYSKTLAPGETWEVAWTLQAAQSGIWTGDVDFCAESEKFVTQSLTVRVH